MAPTFDIDENNILDPIVLDISRKMIPSDKKVSKLAKKARGIDKDGQWRGLALMYEAFKNHKWAPNIEMVNDEADYAISHPGENWARANKEEAVRRFRKMRDVMTNGLPKDVSCPFCAPNTNSIEFTEGDPPCITCNGLGLVNINKEIDCLWCSEPFVESTEYVGEFKFTRIPCSVCGGTHRITIGEVTSYGCRK